MMETYRVNSVDEADAAVGTVEKPSDEVNAEELLADIGKTEGEHICFVCTGNTCRSPMAAALLNHMGKPYNITAESAGISPIPGDGIAENSVKALKAAGIEPCEGNRYDLHTARLMDEETMKRASRVVCMTEGHLFALITAFPQYIEKLCVMPKPVSDPFGGSEERYRACLEEIKSGITELFHLDN